jgi:hypothetical protein
MPARRTMASRMTANASAPTLPPGTRNAVRRDSPAKIVIAHRERFIALESVDEHITRRGRLHFVVDL